MSVVQLKPQATELLDDLDRIRAAIVSGEIQPTTLLLISRDRVNEVVGTKVLGEVLSYSHLLGLLSYASHKVYEELK